MKKLYRVSSAARADLDALWDYIARDKPGAASSFLARLRDRFLLLSRHPLMGEAREDLAPDLRSFPVGNYVIYYRTVESSDFTIEVVRVLHGGRDVNALFGS
jgi:toxin ParE1/3/4